MSRLNRILKIAKKKRSGVYSIIPELESFEAETPRTVTGMRYAVEKFYNLVMGGRWNEEEFWSAYYALQAVVTGEGYRRGRIIHPSTFHKDCYRRVYYELSGVEPTEEIIHDPRLQRIFDVGKFWHSYVQSRLFKTGRLVGAEVPVRHKGLMIDGRADGILDFDGARVLLEIKTMFGMGFNRLKKPMEDHVYQSSVYAKILGLEQILILYINKDTCEFKEFLMEPNQDYYSEVVEGIYEIKECLRTVTVPERICSDKYCSRAHGCNYKTHCFEVDL